LICPRELVGAILFFVLGYFMVLPVNLGGLWVFVVDFLFLCRFKRVSKIFLGVCGQLWGVAVDFLFL
jgi:hypothetical protein